MGLVSLHLHIQPRILLKEDKLQSGALMRRDPALMPITRVITHTEHVPTLLN